LKARSSPLGRHCDPTSFEKYAQTIFGSVIGHTLSEEDVVQKVEEVMPTAKHFFRGQVHHRLRKLSTRLNGTRAVNIHAKQGKYCLPFESRRILNKHTVEDEALKSAVTSSFKIVCWPPEAVAMASTL
jgi:hypothetical protein